MKPGRETDQWLGYMYSSHNRSGQNCSDGYSGGCQSYQIRGRTRAPSVDRTATYRQNNLYRTTTNGIGYRGSSSNDLSSSRNNSSTRPGPFTSAVSRSNPSFYPNYKSLPPISPTSQSLMSRRPKPTTQLPLYSSSLNHNTRQSSYSVQPRPYNGFNSTSKSQMETVIPIPRAQSTSKISSHSSSPNSSSTETRSGVRLYDAKSNRYECPSSSSKYPIGSMDQRITRDLIPRMSEIKVSNGATSHNSSSVSSMPSSFNVYRAPSSSGGIRCRQSSKAYVEEVEEEENQADLYSLGRRRASSGSSLDDANNVNNASFTSTYNNTTSISSIDGTAHSSPGVVGLANLGNTCFMNSVLQCLSNTAPLVKVCLDGTYLSELNKNSRMAGNLFTAYADLMRQLWNAPSPPNYVSPQKFKSQIQKFAPRFMGYSQQDSQEFLRYLLQGLHEDVNRVTRRPKMDIPDYKKEDFIPDRQKAELYWQRYQMIDDSIISDLFMGQLMSTLQCMSCGHKSTTFDPFWDLSLPIPKGYDISIMDCFDLFTSKEILDGAEQPANYLPMCSGCKSRQPCRKSFSFQRFPLILVIHIKRFSGERSRSKLATFIDYPTENLNLQKYRSSCSSESSVVYRLYGVSNHSGSVYDGHYTAYCRHPYHNSWYEYNDTRVHQIQESDVVSSEGYVLFYHRRERRNLNPD